MIWSDYWGALSSRQRIGLMAGVALIVAATIGLAVWLLRDPYVPLASSLSSERLNELTQDLDRAKLDYRIDDSADGVAVPQSQLGKARAASASGQFGVPPSVGLELFKETDFSSTDFAQKINYQRALQGELTRTIQTIAGVRSARVHVILADGGLFKRNAAKASAAVSVALQPGEVLASKQVRGIQRLVAASVPEIKIDDVVVLDESGTSLTRAASETEGELSSVQLDLKRQADQYLESKLSRLLQDLVPQGTASLSVDTVLDHRQLRVTTEEPIATHAGKDAGHATGVLVKERQSQRGSASGYLQASGDAAGADSTDWEYEYKVGNRVEQTLSAPGSIKRISVSVALHGASPALSSDQVEQLVSNAVGIDHSRGDSVAVLLLPGLNASAVNTPATDVARPAPQSAGRVDVGQLPAKQTHSSLVPAWAAALAAVLAALVAAILWWSRSAARHAPDAEVDVEAIAAKVRSWLNEGTNNGRA